MRYVSIDLETTGTNPSVHDIIEFAAVIDDIGSNKPIEKLPTFHRFIKKESSYVCEAKAVIINQRVFEKLASNDDDEIITIEDLMYAFGNFLHSNGLTQNKYGTTIINVAGKNFGTFDYQFLKNKIPDGQWNNISMRHRFIDPSILYFEPGDIALPDILKCTERMEQETGEKIVWSHHSALDDALQIVRLMRHRFKSY
jgi:DNA polymerase III epsilon subunit-like protein